MELAIVENAPEKKKQDVNPISLLLNTKADLRTVHTAFFSSIVFIFTFPQPARYESFSYTFIASSCCRLSLETVSVSFRA